MAKAVPDIVRAGRPRSRGDIIHTINREHGLHHARESGKVQRSGVQAEHGETWFTRLVFFLSVAKLSNRAMRGRSPEGGRSPTEGERPGSLPLMPLLGRDDSLGRLGARPDSWRISQRLTNGLLGQHRREIDQPAPPLAPVRRTLGDPARVFNRQAGRIGTRQG